MHHYAFTPPRTAHAPAARRTRGTPVAAQRERRRRAPIAPRCQRHDGSEHSWGPDVSCGARAAAAAMAAAALASAPAAWASAIPRPYPQLPAPEPTAHYLAPLARAPPPGLSPDASPRAAPPPAASAGPGSLQPPPAAVRPARPSEVAIFASDDSFGPDRHWIGQVLEIGALNILGFWGVQQLVRGALDTSTPVTLVKVRCALHATRDGGLRRRLGEMRALSGAGPEGLWLTLEEAVDEINRRHGSLLYAEASAEYFRSQNAAIEAFKRVAAAEAARTDNELASRVVAGGGARENGGRNGDRARPGPLAGLFGGSKDDGQGVVVVTLVVAARGALEVPPISSWPTLRRTLQQVCGISRSSLIAIELLWAPDGPADELSAADVRTDYPDLIDLSTGRPVGAAAGAAAGDAQAL